MTQQTQRDAVYNAVVAIAKKFNLNFEDNMNVAEIISGDHRKEVINHVIASFNNGQTRLSKEMNDAELRTYCNGLVSNWFRKDTRLNGGTKYEIQNPGSRAGQGNPSIRETKKLLKQVAGTPKEAKVQAVLDKMIAEHKANSKPATKIDADLIPDELKDLVG